MRTPLRPARDAFVVRHILDSHGGVMIAAVAAILLIGVLGAGVVSMVGTSSQEEVRANHGERAFLLAESGFRFAESAYKVVLDDPVQGREAAKAALLALDDFTQAAPGGGAFTLHVSLPEDPYDTEAIVAGNQSVQKGGNLTLQAGANLVPRNGVFRHEGAYYRYREFVNDTLVDIIGVEEGQAFPLNFIENQVLTDYFYSEVVEVVSTGEYPGSGNLNVSRDLTYWWPLPGGGAAGGPGENEFSGEPDVWEDFEDPSHLDDWEGHEQTLGEPRIVDGALNIRDVHHNHAAFLIVYPTSTDMISDYELQVKIKFDLATFEDEQRKKTPKYMAGLTFRKQDTQINQGHRKSFGVSFIKGVGDGIPSFGESPGSGNKKKDENPLDPDDLYIILWTAPHSAVPSKKEELIAYKKLTVPDKVILNNELANWSTLLVRIRELEGNNRISVYYTDASRSANGDSIPVNLSRKCSPRDGLTDNNGTRYLPWPPNDTENWSANIDYFTLVVWDWVNEEKLSDGDVRVLPDGDYGQVIIETDEMTFKAPTREIGLHAFGEEDYITYVYFDDFAFRTAKPGNNGPDVYIPPIVVQ